MWAKITEPRSGRPTERLGAPSDGTRVRIQVFQHAVQQVHFAVVRNGYDRRQVDSDVAEQERRATEARRRIEEAEASLSEVTGRARALEAKISALRARSNGSSARSATPVDELAERLMETVSAAGRDLDGQLKAAANPRGMQGYAVGR